MNRRNFINLAGGGVVLAAAGATGFALTRTPGRALAPWLSAGSYADRRLNALSYAILAPNPHNRQPWIADVRKSGEITLRVDTARMLPATDPFNRQITIGLGCFLELLTLAAAESGDRADIELFPDGSDAQRLTDAPVAVIRLVQDAQVQRDPLFAYVLQRRSNKEPFDTTRAVPQTGLAEILRAARSGHRVAASNEPELVAHLRELSVNALRIEVNTPRTFRESVDLFRIGKREIEANPDGIDFSGLLFETLSLAGQFDREQLLDMRSPAFKQGLDAVLANPATAMAHVWLVSDANERADQIAAGRDWVRMNLAATAEGIGFHPLSQALQEYPEVAEPHRALHALLAPSGGTVQMLCRLGYGPDVAPSPRWNVERKLLI